MRNNVLITGVSGEIGQNLLETLSKSKNLKIIGLDIDSPPENLEKKLFKFHKTDLLDFAAIDKIIKHHKIRTIFHLGAILSSEAEIKPFLAHKINVGATMNLLRSSIQHAAKNTFNIRFIFPSSIAVYHMPTKGLKNSNSKVREDQFLKPSTIYGIGKLYCEQIGSYYSSNLTGNGSGLPRIDFRCIRFPGIISATTLPYGGTSDYAPEILHHAAQNKEYECFVRPDTTIPFMVMPDAIKALIMITYAPESKLKSRVYNVSGFSVSAKEIEKETKRYFPDAKAKYSVNKKRQEIVDSWPRNVNDNAAKKDWKWKPDYTFKKAFRQYLAPAIREKYSV